MRTLLFCLIAATAGLATTAACADPMAPREMPVEATLSLERVRLPGGEAMGLVGATYVFELAPGWWAGPALYGAATGHRGGLFTWGVEGQYRWSPAPRWQLTGGAYVGGGGGAAAPVGGGLMLRPHADLMYDFGRFAAGVGVSKVDFPSGHIRSTQLGLKLAVSDRFFYAPAGTAEPTLRFDHGAGLGIDSLDLAVGQYARGSGLSQAMDFVSLQAAWRQGDVVSSFVQAGAAAKGGAAGYAEFDAGLRALWPGDAHALRVGVQGSLGLAGGGGVAMGGGTLGKVALVGRFQPGTDWHLELQAGRARAFTGDFSSRYAQISFGMPLAPARPDADAPQDLHDTELAVGVEQYLRAQRSAGGDAGLSAVSLELRRSLQGPWFVSARAVSAFSGGAGAYSAGLLGLGLQSRVDERWTVGIEAAAGAGGGGGVASSGGAIIEPLAWAGWDTGGLGRLKLSLGGVKSLRGGLASPVLGLSWAAPLRLP